MYLIYSLALLPLANETTRRLCILPDSIYPKIAQGHSSTASHSSDVFQDLQEVVQGVFTPGCKQCCWPGERATGAAVPSLGWGSTASQALIGQLGFSRLSVFENDTK